MKLNTTYNLKRGALVGLLALLPFAACKKEPVEPEPTPTPVTPAQPTTPKVYTFVYDGDGIPADTARAHLDVDTFYVVPVRSTLFQTISSNGIHNARNHLQSIIDINPKTRGKGDLITIYASVEDSAWLSQFGYNVKREYSKSR